MHELRNQLMVMQSCAENLALLAESDRAAADIAAFRRAAERASALTSDLVHASRSEPQAPGGSIDLNEVIAGANEPLSRLLGETVELRLRLSSDRLTIAAEPDDIEGILLNLALHAREAMPTGGQLTIATTPLGSRVRMTMTDTGAGMAPEVSARIFDPVFTSKATGAGIGLNSVALAVRHLNGTISVETRFGGGTAIHIVFPITNG